MMVVSGGAAHEVTAAVAIAVHAADKTELGEDGDGAGDRNLSHIRIVLYHPFMDGFWSEVVVGAGDDIKHGMALWGELIAVPPEQSGNSVCSEFHADA